MSDHSELKRLAEALPAKAWRAAKPNAGGRGWEVVQGVDQVAADITEARARFIAAANPSAVLALFADNESAHKHWENDSNNVQVLHGEVVRLSSERAQLKAEVEDLRFVLQKIMTQVDGNIRPTVRDCVNGRDDVQDIYGYCDAIERLFDAAMSKEAS